MYVGIGSQPRIMFMNSLGFHLDDVRFSSE
jgi:hypothetical protein